MFDLKNTKETIKHGNGETMVWSSFSGFGMWLLVKIKRNNGLNAAVSWGKYAFVMNLPAQDRSEAYSQNLCYMINLKMRKAQLIF